MKSKPRLKPIKKKVVAETNNLHDIKDRQRDLINTAKWTLNEMLLRQQEEDKAQLAALAQANVTLQLPQVGQDA